MSKKVVTLTTDFGLSDSYAAQVKGVILDTFPDVTIVDVSHQIPPYDIVYASFVVNSFPQYYPDGSIHMAIVDPGVGSTQNRLVIETDKCFFVGPDNGIFSLAVQPMKIKKIISLKEPTCEGCSHTFYGRDIYAKVVGELLKGRDCTEFGTPLSDIYHLKFPNVTITPDSIKGRVIYVDRFGNLITNIQPQHIKEIGDFREMEIFAGDRGISKISNHYGETQEGQILAVWNSYGLLEIAVNRGSAFNLFCDDYAEANPNIQTTNLPLKVKLHFKK